MRIYMLKPQELVKKKSKVVLLIALTYISRCTYTHSGQPMHFCNLVI